MIPEPAALGETLGVMTVLVPLVLAALVTRMVLTSAADCRLV